MITMITAEVKEYLQCNITKRLHYEGKLQYLDTETSNNVSTELRINSAELEILIRMANMLNPSSQSIWGWLHINKNAYITSGWLSAKNEEKYKNNLLKYFLENN